LERLSVVVAEVEDFIKRFTSGELVLLPEAKTMIVTATEGKNFLGRPKKITRNFNDLLGHAIAEYQLQKDVNPRIRLDSAYTVLDLIQRAHAYGVIRDTKQQAMAYEQEIERLKEQLHACRTLNNKLTQENKTLHNLLPNAKKDDTEVGDVQ
jgi:hypothetical protein